MQRIVHLIPATAALLLAALAVAAMVWYAQSTEQRSIYAMIYAPFDQKNLGSALQRRAFEQPDLLPVYGSSELTLQKAYQDPYRAVNLFRGEPDGFNIFPIGQGDTTDLLMLQRLAAVGPTLRGKRVVISLSPTWFFERREVPLKAYAGNFSHLQAGAAIWSTGLSFELKRDIARRMAQYPATLADDPILHFGVQQLAHDTPISRVLYYLALPLGNLQTLILRIQDHWEVLSHMPAQPNTQPSAAPHPPAPDWPGLLEAARRETQHVSANNDLGFDSQDWSTQYQRIVTGRRQKWSDHGFIVGMRRAKEWSDLTLLLRTLHELGAQTLVMSMPIGGVYYDYVGVSPSARAAYYTRISALAKQYGAQSHLFADHDEDRYFVMNARGHLMPEGWVYYSRALDDFYHNRLH